MGNFYTNITVLSERAGESINVIRELGREAYIVHLPNAAVVYDRQCDEQNTGVLSALAEHLSVKLNSVTFAVLNHDDSILWWQLYSSSELIAEYANRGGPKTDVSAMCRTLGKEKEILLVWWILHRPYLFQVSRHKRLVDCLGLPYASVGTGYGYLSRGEVPPGVNKADIIHV
jgi:hypothetical protein